MISDIEKKNIKTWSAKLTVAPKDHIADSFGVLQYFLTINWSNLETYPSINDHTSQ